MPFARLRRKRLRFGSLAMAYACIFLSIVNRDMRIVGIGYNGFPRGCSDDVLPWARLADDELGTKYPVWQNACWLLAVVD